MCDAVLSQNRARAAGCRESNGAHAPAELSATFRNKCVRGRASFRRLILASVGMTNIDMTRVGARKMQPLNDDARVLRSGSRATLTTTDRYTLTLKVGSVPLAVRFGLAVGKREGMRSPRGALALRQDPLSNLRHMRSRFKIPPPLNRSSGLPEGS